MKTEFVDVTDQFVNSVDADKVIDIASGKHFTLVVT